MENMTERYGTRGFSKVPIEDSQNNTIEVFNVYSSLDTSKNKCKKKIYNTILVILVIAIIFMLSKILKITQLINEDPQTFLNDDNVRGNYGPKDYRNEFNEYDNPEEYETFYLLQQKEKIDINKFSSPQLRKPKNIKLIPKLEITLDLEYDKFMHLKIKDADEKRWEVPEKDVLDEDYLSSRDDNRIGMSRYSPVFDNRYFYIELLNDYTEEDNDNKNDEKDPDDDGDDDNDNGKENEHVKKNSTLNNFGFRLMTEDNEEFYSFTTSKNFLYSDTYINFESKLTSNKIYGFGERTHDFQLNEGTYTIWPHDCGGTKYDDGQGGMNQYSHQPIGIHKTKFNDIWLGFVFLNTNSQDVVIHSDKNNTYLTHRTIGGIIDYYIIINDSPEEVVKNIQSLLGIPPLPPFWSFGYHQSRYGYKSFNDFKEVYEKYKSLEIPIDGMWLDIDALDNFDMFTVNDKFKDIIPYIKNTLHEDGGKFIPIADYGFSYENKDNKYVKLGDELDIFIKSNYTKENLIGKVWSDKTVFPDFSHPNISTFWNKGLEDYYNLFNYDGIWLDMNEPANLLEDKNKKCFAEIADEKECTPDKNKYYNDELPYIPGYRKDVKETLSLKSISENALVYGNNTIYDTKPMMSFYQTKHTYNYFKSDLNKRRPFILSRSTSLGSGKYAYHWLGDNLSTFENLKNSVSGIFNFNIFGIPFTGSDICGFMEDATKNLCLRWYNLGVFYPFSRNHNFFAAKDQYPWSFEPDAINIIKKGINYRYSLLRYMYTQFFLIGLTEKGSFFKPLMFEFDNEEASFEDIESKIMIGESFLLCAFFEDNENPKNFTFPNSHFNYYPSGKNLINYDDAENNKVIELSGKFDEIHLFVRGGFIVPYQNTFDKYILNSEKLKDEKMNLIVSIDNFNQSRGEIIYDDEGINPVKGENYYRVDMYYNEKNIKFVTYKNNLNKYDYKDQYLGIIEFWRISNIIETKNKKEKDVKINLNVTFNNKKKPETFEGVYDQENDKVVFDISKGDKSFSIFTIEDITLN